MSLKIISLKQLAISVLCIRSLGTVIAAANLGFPGRGANPKGESPPIFWSKFPENYMKMKKTRPGGRVQDFTM